MSMPKTISTVLAVSVAAGTLFAGGVIAASRGDGAPAPAGERSWLSIPQVHARLEAAGYRNIEKIERERGGYEARATDRNGERVKLYLDAQSGEVIDRRARSRQYDEREPTRSRAGADCSERRCRDDLPAAPGTAPAPAAAAVPAAK